MMHGQNILAKIISWLEQAHADKGIRIAADTPLLAGGVLDSMDLLQLVTWMEEEYGLAVDPDLLTVENFETPATIATVFSNSLTDQDKQ